MKCKVCSVSHFMVCYAVILSIFRLLWYVSIFSHLPSCKYLRACTIGAELCCFVAGQLSWTISIITGHWSQVALSVYHKDLISWLSSTVLGRLSFFEAFHVSLFFETSQATIPCFVPGVIFFFFWQSLGLSNVMVIFLSFCSSYLRLPPFSDCRGPSWIILLMRTGNTVFLLFGPILVLTSHVCLMPQEKTNSRSLLTSTNKSSL